MSPLLLENIWIESRLVSGAIHTSELDRSEIDLSPKRSECERSNANWDRSKIDLDECEHFLKAIWDRSEDRSQIDPTWFDLSVNGLSINWNIEPISPLVYREIILWMALKFWNLISALESVRLEYIPRFKIKFIRLKSLPPFIHIRFISLLILLLELNCSAHQINLPCLHTLFPSYEKITYWTCIYGNCSFR